MAETLSLLEFIQKLFTDSDLRALFSENPDRALEQHGLSDLSEADVRDALVLVDDSQTADFSRDYSGQGASFGSSHFGDSHRDHDNHNDHDNHDGDGHRAAVEHLSTFITNNFVDDRDTIVDNSINQHIDTHGGDFDQNIDIDANIATGDGAIAADDIRDSTVTTGHDNVIGDGNAVGEGNIIGHDNVTGDHNITGNDNQVVDGQNNTTSFGEGDANSVDVGDDLNTGDGSSFGLGSGTTTTDNSDHSTNDSFNDSSDHSTHDSGNTSIDASVEDSFNESHHTEFEDSFNDNSETSNSSHTEVSDSHHVEV